MLGWPTKKPELTPIRQEFNFDREVTAEAVAAFAGDLTKITGANFVVKGDKIETPEPLTPEQNLLLVRLKSQVGVPTYEIEEGTPRYQIPVEQIRRLMVHRISKIAEKEDERIQDLDVYKERLEERTGLTFSFDSMHKMLLAQVDNQMKDDGPHLVGQASFPESLKAIHALEDLSDACAIEAKRKGNQVALYRVNPENWKTEAEVRNIADSLRYGSGRSRGGERTVPAPREGSWAAS